MVVLLFCGARFISLVNVRRKINLPGTARQGRCAVLTKLWNQKWHGLFVFEIRIAEAQFGKVKRNLVHSILTLAGDVKSTIPSLHSAHEIVEFRKNIVESLRASTEITRRMHAAGGANDLDLATDHALFARGKLELAQAEADVIQ